MAPPKSAVEGRFFYGQDYRTASVWWSTRLGTTKLSKTRTAKVAAMERMMATEMAERHIEGSGTYAELGSRVAAERWEKMVQQGHAPREMREVEDGDAA